MYDRVPVVRHVCISCRVRLTRMAILSVIMFYPFNFALRNLNNIRIILLHPSEVKHSGKKQYSNHTNGDKDYATCIGLPSSAHRNPSITPTIGFRPYTIYFPEFNFTSAKAFVSFIIITGGLSNDLRVCLYYQCRENNSCTTQSSVAILPGTASLP